VLGSVQALVQHLQLKESAHMETLSICMKQLTEHSQTTRDFASALTERSMAMHHNSLLALSAVPEQIMVVNKSLRDGLVSELQNFGRAIQTMPATFAETWSAQLPSLIQNFSETAATLVRRNFEESRRLTWLDFILFG